ncbi:MAG TPA: FtsX-like permease family protein [Bryobacteraceae bacterium]|nr:FtsX-like permease family protein [Bryobacteraceae bacterium]
MTGKLVFENLKHRPMRSLLSVLLIGVPVTLILTLVGMTHGMLEDSQHRQEGIGADIIMRGSTSTSVMTLSGPSIPEAMVPRIEQEPHVAEAMGVVVHNVDLPLAVLGIDMAKFNQMSGGFKFLSGHTLQNPDDILVDDLYAAQRHLKVGDTLNLINHAWHVAGIVASGKMARLVVDRKVLQTLDAATGKVSTIYVKVDRPDNIDVVLDELRRALPNYKIDTMQYWISMFNAGQIQGIREFTVVVAAIGVVIGFAVVCLSMYMAVLQRTREIGILKSLGASKGFILGIILAEALLLGVGGTVLGIIFSFCSRWLIATLVPASIQMAIVPAWWPVAGLITLFGATLGALYPGLSAARHDPIEALAYE